MNYSYLLINYGHCYHTKGTNGALSASSGLLLALRMHVVGGQSAEITLHVTPFSVSEPGSWVLYASRIN